MIRHAGLIARFERGGWRGVLIEGPSGSGKSDLALRALAAGWTLVADDRTLVWSCAGRLYGRPPSPLAGMVEARGLGVLGVPHRPFARIALVARCVDPPAIDRAPEPGAESLLGVIVPLIALAALEPSAPAKLCRALDHIGLARQQAYQAARAGRVAAGRGPVRFPK